MRSSASIGLALGLAGFTAILVWQGVGEIAAVLGSAGMGLLVVAAFHLVPLAADAIGWRALLDRAPRPSAGTLLRCRWMGEAVNSLLPVMQVGGAVVRGRLLARAGVDPAAAAASVVVDVTLVLASQVVFTVLGLVVLVAHLGGGGVGATATVGTVMMALAVTGFVAVQRGGMLRGLASTLSLAVRRRDWSGMAERAAAVDAQVTGIYGEPRLLLTAGAWHLASWVLGVGETWLALAFLGHPVGFAEAFLLESLAQAVRAAAFAVPAGLGVQEGGYLLLGRALGLSPKISIALSLARRVRELCVGLPGLVAWQAGWGSVVGGDLPQARGAERA